MERVKNLQATEWVQREIKLSSKPKGFHLVTSEILEKIPEIAEFSVGIAHFFIQHTSASLSINENADPDVRADMESHFNHLVPEDAPYYSHTIEGPDDMPSHLKTTIIGAWVSVPITEGELNLGTWQGLYLGEHRNHGGPRRIVVTILGQKKA